MHLPIGVSNFRELTENKDPDQQGYLFVDKTLYAIWGLLLMSGYLKYVSYQDEDTGCLCELKLSNNEIENFYIGTVIDPSKLGIIMEFKAVEDESKLANAAAYE